LTQSSRSETQGFAKGAKVSQRAQKTSKKQIPFGNDKQEKQQQQQKQKQQQKQQQILRYAQDDNS
jgi:hypothetical protein